MTILLTGCATNNNNIALSNDDLFAKKKECAELQAKIESHIEKDWNDEDRSAWLEKIFYSQKKNTCLYTMQISTSVNNVTIEIHNLFDAFTNEKIVSERGCLPVENCGKTLMQASAIFDNTVANYE